MGGSARQNVVTNGHAVEHCLAEGPARVDEVVGRDIELAQERERGGVRLDKRAEDRRKRFDEREREQCGEALAGAVEPVPAAGTTNGYA